MRGRGVMLVFAMLAAACTATPTATPTRTPASEPAPSPAANLMPVATPTLTPRSTVTPDTIPEQLRPTLTARPTPTAARPTPTATHTQPAEACVSGPNPRFTAAHTDLSKVEFIIPMVVPSGGWLKNRSYFVLAEEPGTGKGYEVPVFAPVDSTLVGITRYISVGPDTTGAVVEADELDLVFSVSCEVGYGFDHVARLVGAAAEVQPAVAVLDTRNAQKQVRIEYSAGDLIGYTTGTQAAHTWDFIVTNTTSEVQYANQVRYETVGDLSRLRDAACPFDYYDEPLRSQYLALLGGWGAGAVGGEGCLGSPDVAGTIAGGWFASKWDPAAASHVADWGAVVVLGADGTVEVDDGSRMVRTRRSDPTWAGPRETTEHCYESSFGSGGYAYVALVDEATMAVAMGDGACPASLPAGHKLVYR